MAGEAGPPGRPEAPILLVEDDETLREALVDLLEGEGYDAEAVPSLAVARARLEIPPPPRLVVLDLILPGESGLDLLDEVRARPDLRDVPVLVFTAREDAETERDARARGADRFVRKSGGAGPLIEALRSLQDG